MALSPDLKKSVSKGSGRALYRLMRLVWRTSTPVMEPPDGQQLYIDNHPAIIAVWHGQFMMLAAFNPEELKVSAMVARHTDAEVIAEALRGFNIDLVRGAGSQGRKFKMSRGGIAALRAAVRALKDGRTLVMTADVPPGPARKAGAGIVTLAKLSGRPVLPVAVSSSRFKALNTWSRATINLPYSKLACVVGEPIWVPSDADENTTEAKRREIEDRLNEVTARAYELSGGDIQRVTPPGLLGKTAPLAKPGLKLAIYRRGTAMLRPVAPLLLKMRQRRGKEDPERLPERYAIASAPRPAGTVVWVHAASVGETNAILPVIDTLLAERDDVFVVLTTGTVTSANIAAERLPERAIHQYVPLDAAAYAKRFLDHWKPSLAIFTESEIWPNLIFETKSFGTPMMLVNARMSQSSHRRWSRNSKLAAALFSRFDCVLAQNAIMARRFNQLGARVVINAGNLKADAPPPPVDAGAVQEMKVATGKRPVLVGASTHDGEDGLLIAAHRLLRQRMPDLLTIIAPRHPERGPDIRALAEAQGCNVRQRSLREPIKTDCELYIADTIGEMGLFYAVADVAFVGGSLVERGGQNPLEPVAIGTAVLTGPSQFNFQDTYAALIEAGGVRQVATVDDIAATVEGILMDPAARQRQIEQARRCLATLQGALKRTIEEVVTLLPDKGAA
jgi:3-deoxy-D-manno-octulosonic-acid transferase